MFIELEPVPCCRAAIRTLGLMSQRCVTTATLQGPLAGSSSKRFVEDRKPWRWYAYRRGRTVWSTHLAHLDELGLARALKRDRIGSPCRRRFEIAVVDMKLGGVAGFPHRPRVSEAMVCWLWSFGDVHSGSERMVAGDAGLTSGPAAADGRMARVTMSSPPTWTPLPRWTKTVSPKIQSPARRDTDVCSGER